MEPNEYFEYLETLLEEEYQIAQKARKQWKDPVPEIEIPRAKDMADRVESLVGPRGIAETIRELDGKGFSREDIALKVIDTIIESQFQGEKTAEQCVRTSLAILTEGIVAAPLEGIAKVKIKSNFDGTTYLAIYFAGPIRSAGGTAAALVVLLGDYIRQKLHLDSYKITDDESERYIEEMELYNRITRLQYFPSPDETKQALKNIPVEITGEPTEQEEVSGHRNLERVETNGVRGGALLALAESVIQKSKKVFKYAQKFGIPGWEWLNDFHKVMAQEEGYEIDERALSAVAKAADGSMRDAQSLLDQIISYCGPSVPDEAVAEILGIAGREYFYRISGAILGQDPRECIEALDEVYRSGYDINQFYQDLVEHFRSLLMARLLPDPSSVLDMADGEIQELKKQVEQTGPEDLRRLVSILLKAEEDILRSSQPRMGMEITLIKMAHLGRLEPLEKILEKITSFEEAMPPGPAARRAPSPGPPAKKARTRPAEARASSTGPRPREGDKNKPEAPRPASPSRVPWNAPHAWQSFVDTVRRDRAMTAALLEDVGQWEVNEDAVKVFCEKGTFLFDQLGTQETRTLLSKSARDCFGEAVRFEVCVAKGLNDSKAKPSGNPEQGEAKALSSPSAVDEARNDQTVKTALEVFHGTIKDVKLFGSDTGEEEEI